MKSALSEKIEDEYDAADLLEAVAHFEKEIISLVKSS